MKVTVFGATGAIGALTVAELLAANVEVTAYVRNPSKVPKTWTNVRVVQGEVSDKEAILTAVAGADVVVSALGPSMEKNVVGHPLIQGTENIIQAMRKHGVKRYIGHATPSFKDPKEEVTWVPRVVGFLGRHMLPRAYEELIGMCKLIAVDDIEWTIIRFIAPNDKPKTGQVTAGYYGEVSPTWAVTRGDIAAFTAAQVTSREYIRRAPVIGNT